MKVNHHSLKYKKQKEPNKKYKDLKAKQKGKIAAWMFEKTCCYYHRSGTMPEEEQVGEIVREVYKKIESQAIWIPFEKVLCEYLKKLPRYGIRIQESGIPEEIINPKPKEIKTEKKAQKSKRRHHKKRVENVTGYENTWQDDNFYFIVGYTSGGAPYGTTWEEMGLEPWQELDN